MNRSARFTTRSHIAPAPKVSVATASEVSVAPTTATPTAPTRKRRRRLGARRVDRYTRDGLLGSRGIWVKTPGSAPA